MNAGVRGIHHINFVVRDLDAAEARYRRLLGLEPALREALPERGVLTARFRIGAVWLVLVQPLTEDGEPARHLREHGEGFFLLSFTVDDLDSATASARASGVRFTTGLPRRGLAHWRVIDFDPADTLGAILQLTEEGPQTGGDDGGS
jgi:methylmalonyl-CoA/ethylmalonyl-CoA epimerase